MSFQIRPYRPGDEVKINEMFNEVFRENRDISHWYWKYRDNPNGFYTLCIAESGDGVIAAHYGGYPVVLYSAAGASRTPIEFTSFHLGDKMTRKEFRGIGRGKSSLLARTFYLFRDTFASEGIPFGYGFGTHHSLRFGLLFLDYADVEPVPFRQIPAVSLSRIKTSRLKNAIRRIKVCKVVEIGEEFTEFFYRVAPSYKYLVKRDSAYLKWRYLDRPDRRYLMMSVTSGKKILGWSVFHRQGDRIIWGDALFQPDDPYAVECILSALHGDQWAQGGNSIECWFPPRPEWWDKILLSLGFTISAEPDDLHFTGPVFNDPESPAVLRKYFYYAKGDSDMF